MTCVQLLLQTAAGAKGFISLAVCGILGGKKYLYLGCGRMLAWSPPEWGSDGLLGMLGSSEKPPLVGNPSVMQSALWMDSGVKWTNASTPCKLHFKISCLPVVLLFSHCSSQQKPKCCFMQSLIKSGYKWGPKIICIMWGKIYMYRWKPFKWQNFVAEAIVIY